MTAPRWIIQALEHAAPAGVMGTDAEALAAALLERLPIEAMVAEFTVFPNSDRSREEATSVVARIARVLSEDDPEVVELTELYQSACKALDAAGVPHAINTAEVYRPLDLAGRIQWLAEQRPLRIDLQRVEAERDGALKLAPELARMTVERDLALRELDATRRMAASAADDLDRERRAHQEVIGEAAATEIRLQTAIDESHRVLVELGKILGPVVTGT